MKPLPYFLLIQSYRQHWRVLKSSTNIRWHSSKTNTNNMRVIGVMAHIDAGKTTTTERMLYYSGFQQTVGEVHHGDTTMDYLEQERERGITIQSAAVSFPWQDHTISLVDTPGHVDFTIEVERSVRVVDGAVAVLDASAGVEAQTLTVWQQAQRYGVPRICYLNKMDKPAASHTLCLEDISRSLKVNPLLLQLPIRDLDCSIASRQFCGVVDLIEGTQLKWKTNSKKDHGRSYSESPLTEQSELFSAYREARANLCDQLGDVDEAVAEYIVENEDPVGVPASLLHSAVRKATLHQDCVPVLLGSSYRNVGVQPLMNAIIKYLPTPTEKLPDNVKLYSPKLCALAFKIIYSPQKGLLTFIRVYSGVLEQDSKFFNVSRGCWEKATKLYTIAADELLPAASASAGSIVAVAGLRQTATGDTLVSNQKAVEEASQKLSKRKTRKVSSSTPTVSPDDVTEGDENEVEEEDNEHLLVGVRVPQPVFFCSIEAASPRHQKGLDAALTIMQREDPSLKVSHDQDTGQMVLSGMGELHLEIVLSRLVSQYKVEADIGKLQVAYREHFTSEAPVEKHTTVNRIIGELRQHVELCLVLQPQSYDAQYKKLSYVHTKDNADMLASLRRNHLAALTAGISAALSGGPVLSSPVWGVSVGLKWFTTTKKTTDAFITAATTQCIRQLLAAGGCMLAEPIMYVFLTGEEEYCQNLIPMLNKRRGEVLEVTTRGGIKYIKALVPLAELIGYSSEVRKMSSGRVSLTMELHQYRTLSPHDQREAIKSVTGFYPSTL